MSSEISHEPLPLGLLELDPAGKVLYYNPSQDEDSSVNASEVLGRNLFEEVVTEAEAKELKEQFNSFKTGHAPVSNLDLTVPSNRGNMHARVMMLRVYEHSVLGHPESILVHIRKA